MTALLRRFLNIHLLLLNVRLRLLLLLLLPLLLNLEALADVFDRLLRPQNLLRLLEENLRRQQRKVREDRLRRQQLTGESKS